ncbi:MAG: PilZ domain-containing protein, partial [Rhizobiales bacterium]|nr:PilZ domain-containing protein [Hyphomicrobiales bacterium]
NNTGWSNSITVQEKRHEPRLKALKRARLHFDNGVPPAECTIRQLSVDGARVKTDRALQLDDHVGLYFFTENATLMAKVAWLEGGIVGLAFDRPVPWLARHIQE